VSFLNIFDIFRDRRDKSAEAFEEILRLRKDIRTLRKQKREAEIKGQKSKAAKYDNAIKSLLGSLEDANIVMCSDPDRGLYAGLAIDLKEPREMKPLYMEWDKVRNHKLTLATTQTGKTRALACDVKQAIAKGWNTVIYDPKGGEGQEILGWVMEAAGASNRANDWMYISAVYPDMSDQINPLYGFQNEEIASMISLIAVPPTDAGADAQFYASIAFKTVITVLTAYEYMEKATDPDGVYKEAKRRYEILEYYRRRIMLGSKADAYDPDNNIIIPDIADRLYRAAAEGAKSEAGEEFAEVVGSQTHLFDEKFGDLIVRLSAELAEKKPAQHLDRTFITFLDISSNVTYEALTSLKAQVEGFPPPRDKPELKELQIRAKRLLGDILDQDRMFYTKVSVGLATVLTQLSYGAIGKLFCTIKINPLIERLYREDKGVVAIIQPAPLKFQKVSDMISKIIMNSFQLVIGTTGSTSNPLPRRTVFVIDEMGDVLYPGIENFLNKGAGLGFTVWGYSQSFRDFEAKLGKPVATRCLDNINVYQIGRMNDNESCKTAADKFGVVRKIKAGTMGAGEDAGTKRTVDVIEEPAVKPENFTLAPNSCFYTLYDRQTLLVEAPFQGDPKGSLTTPVLGEIESRKQMSSDHKAMEDQFADSEAQITNALFAMRETARELGLDEKKIDGGYDDESGVTRNTRNLRREEAAFGGGFASEL
jgi:hypothetical protein